MQIDFFGANCLKIKTHNTTLVFDDNMQSLGAKSIATANDVVCLTNNKLIEQPQASRIIFEMPGSYEVSDILIDGIRAQAFMDTSERTDATIYKIMSEDFSLAVVGHINPALSEEQLEQLGLIDILFVPVGNGGYTLDATGALQVTKSINPKVVIPTHYQQAGLKFETPQQSYEEFVRLLAAEVETVEGSLKLKKNDLGEQLNLKIFKNLKTS